MKNQYFGDINDYRKYGLLRALWSGGQGSLLVVWMLTPDDGNSDGRFRSYLRESERWRDYDQGLFDGLTSLLRSSAPNVSLIEQSNLLPMASFYSVEVPDTREDRAAWRRGLLEAVGGVDLVFFDPDNGIEVPSKPVGRKGSSKYVTWCEIEACWDAGCSVLIYQHFRREKREPLARRLVLELKNRTGAYFTEAFRTPRVLFLLAAQRRHARIFQDGLQRLSRWGEQIKPMGFWGELE